MTILRLKDLIEVLNTVSINEAAKALYITANIIEVHQDAGK